MGKLGFATLLATHRIWRLDLPRSLPLTGTGARHLFLGHRHLGTPYYLRNRIDLSGRQKENRNHPDARHRVPYSSRFHTLGKVLCIADHVPERVEDPVPTHPWLAVLHRFLLR